MASNQPPFTTHTQPHSDHHISQQQTLPHVAATSSPLPTPIPVSPGSNGYFTTIHQTTTSDYYPHRNTPAPGTGHLLRLESLYCSQSSFIEFKYHSTELWE